MKKLCFAIVLAAMFAMPMTASAEKIDFGKLKCSAFMELDAQTMTMFYFGSSSFDVELTDLNQFG